MIRHHSDGALDETFSGGGKATVDFGGASDKAYSVAFDSSGRALVAGESKDRFAIARLLLEVPDVSIAGRILSPGGLGLRNAVVTLTDSAGNRRTATTSTLGFYSFDEIQAGETVALSVTSWRYRFEPVVRRINENLTDVDMMAME